MFYKEVDVVNSDFLTKFDCTYVPMSVYTCRYVWCIEGKYVRTYVHKCKHVCLYICVLGKN